MHVRCFLLGAILVRSLCIPASLAAVHPRFEPSACIDLPDIADLLPRLRCGKVRVPRDHAHPNGATVALAVVVIASALQPAEADPVVYISGGPGAPLTIYSGYQARHPYAASRAQTLVAAFIDQPDQAHDPACLRTSTLPPLAPGRSRR